MCMTIAAECLKAWLESQERMVRAWLCEAALDPGADPALLALMEGHCRWLERERAALAPSSGH